MGNVSPRLCRAVLLRESSPPGPCWVQLAIPAAFKLGESPSGIKWETKGNKANTLIWVAYSSKRE